MKTSFSLKTRARNNFRIVSGQIHFCSVTYRFWPVKCIWWITLLGAHKHEMTNWKLLIKVEIFGNFVTGSGRIPMSVSMRELYTTTLVACTCHQDFIRTLNLFHFQYDWILTGQHDRQDESLTGQIHNQSGHCPLTGRYFKPWKTVPTYLNNFVICSRSVSSGSDSRLSLYLSASNQNWNKCFPEVSSRKAFNSSIPWS